MSRILYPAPGPTPGAAPPTREPLAFHRAIGAGAPTPLAAVPSLAAALGAGAVHVKLETSRMDLPSFKIMGASWATVEALRRYLPASWTPRDGLAALAATLPPLTLVAASEGNHGHALAAIARLLGLRARIILPETANETRIAGILAEGAEVIRVDDTYDAAVDRSARYAADDGHVLVSDTSWHGYENVPAAVIDGYSTILWETQAQLTRTPDLVVVPVGVGAFATAVIRHFRSPGTRAPRIVGVEPARAACVMASLAAGRRLTVPGPHHSSMAGLNCGTPSYVAWPVLRTGFDAMVAVEDEPVGDGVRALADAGLSVGQCSGAAVAAAHALLTGADRHKLDLPDQPTVLLFATEGPNPTTATDVLPHHEESHA